MAGQDLEVSIGVEDSRIGSDGHCGDQAVDETSDGLAAMSTAPVQRCCLLVGDRLGGHHRGLGEETPQVWR